MHTLFCVIPISCYPQKGMDLSCLVLPTKTIRSIDCIWIMSKDYVK